jgi:thymidylate kinase
MIVIIEGPDGAGKTTFAKSFSGGYHHEGPPPAGDASLLGYYYAKVAEADVRGGTVVFDRLAAGEVVYGPILRGTARLTEADYRAFVNMTRTSHGAIHVTCLPPKDVCLLNWKRRAAVGGELFEDRDLFERTYDAFAALAGYSDLVYDYTAGGKR